MPFIPHTQEDLQAMLAQIGVSTIEQLFDEIPAQLRNSELAGIPEGLNEQAMCALMQTRAEKNQQLVCFLGAGAYAHHIPAAVWEIASRGEFLTAYTPYQAEVSQGTLQVVYEYQTMMANLLGMDVANASLYDGASALGEAVLMAVRANKQTKSRRILIAGTVHPYYRQTVQTIVSNQEIELVELAFCAKTGTILADSLTEYAKQDFAALVIAEPNFFGCLEAVDELTDWAHAAGGYVIACVNPIAMALLKEPGAWGQRGADIACGEGQPLGIPMAAGGPYFGFLCCRMQDIRQMPGRLVGRTKDLLGQTSFTLTLQAREQHIRRSKARSNICTNQGLMVTAACIYMSLLGAQGLRQQALKCHENTQQLKQRLLAVTGVEAVFSSPFFHEFVFRVKEPVNKSLMKLDEAGILGGFPLGTLYPNYQDCILVCATELITTEQIETYVRIVNDSLNQKP